MYFFINVLNRIIYQLHPMLNIVILLNFLNVYLNQYDILLYNVPIIISGDDFNILCCFNNDIPPIINSHEIDEYFNLTL